MTLEEAQAEVERLKKALVETEKAGDDIRRKNCELLEKVDAQRVLLARLVGAINTGEVDEDLLLAAVLQSQ